jgi:protein-S-isoprenylcysteine O-methyltransferase Ste14
MTSSGSAARWAYGALFSVALPLALVAWASAASDVAPVPAIPGAGWGAAALGLGIALMVAGMVALWRHGGGLPMSPFPPPRYVARGIYGVLAHPIYLGFAIAVLGAALWRRSAIGVWLVFPMVVLASVAWVLGFERHALRQRFGDQTIRRPRIALPPPTPDPVTAWDRVSVVVLVFLPWSLVFEGVYRLGIPSDALNAHLPFERSWPVLEWTEAIYGSVYLFVVGAVFGTASRAALRRFAVRGLIATAVATLIYLTVPLVAPPRPFEAHTWLGRALLVERAMSHTVAAFPAFHVIWSCLAAEAWSSRGRGATVLAWGWASAIAVSCLATGMHAVVDIVAAVVVFLIVRQYRAVWAGLRWSAERLANSWREWRIGRVRVINHGAYAGLGGAVAFTIAAGVAGPGLFWQLVLTHVAGLAGAGLWAQTLEGSPKLSRPFGYYGSVIGGIGGALIAGWIGGHTMLLLAAIALEAPWLQAIGRARCLVQGCCHGGPAPEALGIRYWRDRSRVCSLADLRGIPLHPTPLYSMLANVVTGILLLRLWSLGAAPGLIAGGYLLLAGAARFVEESYRGEPQTLVIAGLRIYQWLAMLSFVMGAFLTTVPPGVTRFGSFQVDGRVLITAVTYGLICWFAMGVDFPGSSRRFARLAQP